MNWLKSFKIAVIEEDVTTIDKLLKEIPEFKKIEEMREAYTLIGEAKKRFEIQQIKIQKKMNKIQQTKKFLNIKEKENRLSEVF